MNMTLPTPFSTLANAVKYWNQKIKMDHPRGPVSVDVCFKLRDLGYKPYAHTRIYGFDVEWISFPFPSEYGASIMVRVPDDPTTMVEAAINPKALELAGAQ